MTMKSDNDGGQARPWHDDFLTLYWYDQLARTDGDESFRKYDPSRIMRELLRLNADIYVLYAVSQMGDAYYPSRVLPAHPALKGHDYVGELLHRLKKAGKRVVLYVNWGTSHQPNWREIGPDGKFIQPWTTEYYVPCLLSPQQEVIRKVTRELTERYDFDGLSLDMYISYAHCTCPYCQPHLRKLLGKRGQVKDRDILRDLPAYYRWREEHTSDYLREINAILAAKDIVPFHNGFSPIWNRGGVGSLGWRNELNPYITEVYRYNANLEIKLHHAMKRTSCALITSTADAYSHVPIGPVEFQHFAATAKGNAGRILGVCGIGAYPDTTTSRRLLDNVRQTFAFYKRDAEFCRGAQPAGEVALVYSYDTRRHDLRDQPIQSHNFEFFGLSRVLQEAHIPWNALIAEIDDMLESLLPSRLLILPATTCLSDRFVESLIQYLRQGGRVLATGMPGLWKSADMPRRTYPLADALGLRPRGVRPSACFHVEDAYEPVVFVGRSYRVNAKSGVLRRYIPVGADRPVFAEKNILPADRPTDPLVIQNRHGKGTSVCAAFEPGGFYYEQGQYQVRELLESLLAAAYPPRLRQIRTNLPDTVEITATEQPSHRRRIIHLINKTTSGHYMGRETNRAIHQVVPVCHLELELRNIPAKARVSLAHMEGTVRPGRSLRVDIDKLEAYGAILIETP
ncbi:MAG: hypothetical protein IT440_12125 [Phycisphaeraceae bacterium]|nr:hypothetical protein [Phycisphaeraceae bacterium]